MKSFSGYAFPPDLNTQVKILTSFNNHNTKIKENKNIAFFKRNLDLRQSSGTSLETVFCDENACAIVGDICIHNKREIGSIFALSANELEEITNTKLFLLCYAKWGRECLQHIVGEFSFALWDEKTQELFCAVDHFGVKPFFFRLDGGQTVVFSNRLGELVGNDILRSQLNQDYLLDYLLGVYKEKGCTVYRDIFCLEPGSYLMGSKAGGINCHKYWMPVTSGNIGLHSKTNNADRLRELIEESVQGRLIGNEDIGVLLSGGLDSSAITGIASRFLRRQGRTISAYAQVLPESYVGEEKDEREYVEHVCRKFDVKVTYCTENAFMNKDSFESFFRSQFTIPFNPFFCLSKPLFQTVSQHQAGLLLTGNGGDNITSNHGNGYYALLAKKCCWRELFKVIRECSLVENRTTGNLLKQRVLSPLAPDLFRKVYRKVKGNSWYHPVKESFIRTDLVEKYFLRKRVKQRGEYVHVYSATDPREEIQDWIRNNYFSICFDMDAYLSEHYSIRSTHPLLDKRIVDFIMTIPPGEFVKGGWSRSLFRRSMVGILPSKIQYRKGKMPFCGTKENCLVQSQDYVRNILENKNNVAWDIIDRGRLRRQYNAFVENSAHQRCSEVEAYSIGRCIVVAAFLQWHGV